MDRRGTGKWGVKRFFLKNKVTHSILKQRLQELLDVFPDEPIQAQRFNKISKALGTRTPKQVASRVQKYFIKLAKRGLPVPGRITIPVSFFFFFFFLSIIGFSLLIFSQSHHVCQKHPISIVAQNQNQKQIESQSHPQTNDKRQRLWVTIVLCLVG
jgi:hypothetical protein